MIPLESVPAALQQLNQALDNHERWTRELVRTLACRLPPDEHDLLEDAHRHCRFGQWYYGIPEPHLKDHVGFTAVEQQHRLMHGLAARLLEGATRGQSIRAHDYDQFATALDLLRLQLNSLIRELEAQLHDFDPLTGAETRTRMLPALRDMMEVVARRNMECCIAVVDLDHFKSVNDMHGHLVGDQALAGTVALLREGLRGYDKIYRFGGEEFLIALPHAGLDAGRGILDRTRARLADSALVSKLPDLRLTASIGVTSLMVQYSIEECIAHADAAMYKAKQAGRNCIVEWAEGMMGPGDQGPDP